ncbi:MAG: YARHG domain-containing protein [Pseudomonadota bacterium]
MKNHAVVFLIMILAILLQPVAGWGQTGEIICHAGLGPGNTIDASRLEPSLTSDTSDYAGVYGFGTTGTESYLLVVPWNGVFIVQHKKKLPDGNGGWTWEYQNMDSVAMEGNRIISRGWMAEFASHVVYSRESVYNANLISTRYPMVKANGLLIRKSPMGIRNEFGIKTEDGLENCPRSSVVLLVEDDIRGKTREELQIMRNEIFALYGFMFTPGGQMDAYFRTKNWYTPRYKEVFPWLTEIEKANIAFIKSHE